MKPDSPSEHILIEEVTHALQEARKASRGLTIGILIKSIRIQLGMPQTVLAKKAGMGQASISRIEQGKGNASLSTLNKVLQVISCDLVIAPLLQDSIESIRRRQARKVAQKQIRYLEGTMNLEDQQPDSRFMEALIKQEEERLLNGPNAKLWED